MLTSRFCNSAWTFSLLAIIFTTPKLDAGLITFDLEADFLSQADKVQLEDFNSFTIEEAFHTNPLALDDFLLSMTGTPSTSRNFIDVPTSSGSTPHAVVRTDSDDSLFFTFASPISAFALWLSRANEGKLRSEIVVNGTTIQPDFTGPGDHFFGLISTSGFTTVEFRGIASDDYRLDDVSYSFVNPEPSTLVLVLSGGLGAMCIVYSRKRRRAAIGRTI